MNRLNYHRISRINIFISCVFSIILIGATFCLSGCSEEETFQEPQIPAHFTTYTDESGLFSISYPPDWEPVLSIIEDAEQLTKAVYDSINLDIPLDNVSFIFTAGVLTENGLAPNVSIVVEPLPVEGMSHNQMVESAIKVIKQYLPDFHEFSRINTIIDGRESTIIDCEVTITGMGTYRQLQMYTLVGNTAWAVGCVHESDKFSGNEDDFYAVVRSLRILK